MFHLILKAYQEVAVMYALGQKQTHLADMRFCAAHVPIADMTSVRIGVSPTQSKRGRLFDALTVYRYEPIVSGR
jgi:hypothetical protein